jgi:hypothetical protein
LHDRVDRLALLLDELLSLEALGLIDVDMVIVQSAAGRDDARELVVLLLEAVLIASGLVLLVQEAPTTLPGLEATSGREWVGHGSARLLDDSLAEDEVRGLAERVDLVLTLDAHGDT